MKARQLFLPYDETEDARDAIARRINVFVVVGMDPGAYHSIIGRGDPYDNCTDLDKIKLQDQAMYLIKALNNALSYYPSKNWGKCCDEASKSGC